MKIRLYWHELINGQLGNLRSGRLIEAIVKIVRKNEFDRLEAQCSPEDRWMWSKVGHPYRKIGNNFYMAIFKNNKVWVLKDEKM